MKLEGRRMRSDLVETFKIINGKYDINPELFFQLGESGRRGHDQKLFKKIFSLDLRKNVFFLIELLIIGICSLSVVLAVTLLTLSRNSSRLNWTRKLWSLKCVTCDSMRNTAKACAYSCQHCLWHTDLSKKFGEFTECFRNFVCAFNMCI